MAIETVPNVPEAMSVPNFGLVYSALLIQRQCRLILQPETDSDVVMRHLHQFTDGIQGRSEPYILDCEVGDDGNTPLQAAGALRTDLSRYAERTRGDGLIIIEGVDLWAPASDRWQRASAQLLEIASQCDPTSICAVGTTQWRQRPPNKTKRKEPHHKTKAPKPRAIDILSELRPDFRIDKNCKIRESHDLWPAAAPRSTEASTTETA